MSELTPETATQYREGYDRGGATVDRILEDVQHTVSLNAEVRKEHEPGYVAALQDGFTVYLEANQPSLTVEERIKKANQLTDDYLAIFDALTPRQ